MICITNEGKNLVILAYSSTVVVNLSKFPEIRGVFRIPLKNLRWNFLRKYFNG